MSDDKPLSFNNPKAFDDAGGFDRCSAICCQKCGERIHSTPYRWGSYQWLCGLCLDDILNEDAKVQ